MKNKMKELDELLANELMLYGFKMKRGGGLKRIINDCIQEICMSATKIRGEEKVHIYVQLSYTYKKLNNLIMYLQNDDYYKGWATGRINMDNLIQQEKVFGFYIEKTSALNPIVNEIVLAIKKYALPFFESCDSIEKLEKEIHSSNEQIIDGMIYKYEWNMLGLAILTRNYSVVEILNKYQDALGNSEKELEEINERINNETKILELIK